MLVIRRDQKLSRVRQSRDLQTSEGIMKIYKCIKRTEATTKNWFKSYLFLSFKNTWQYPSLEIRIWPSWPLTIFIWEKQNGFFCFLLNSSKNWKNEFLNFFSPTTIYFNPKRFPLLSWKSAHNPCYINLLGIALPYSN